MKIDFQWPYAIMFCVVFAGITFLVYAGKLHHEALSGMLLWLAPSPLSKKQGQEPESK